MNVSAGAFSRGKKRAWILALALVVALVLAQTAWADHKGESDWNVTYREVSPASSFASTDDGSGGNSGDDAYDAAAGGYPEVSLVESFQAPTGSSSSAGAAATSQDFALLAASPELIAARSYYHTSATSEGLFAMNPELSAARSYASFGAAGGSGAFLALNPELSAFRNYSDAVERSALEGEFTFFSENPEVQISREYCGC